MFDIREYYNIGGLSKHGFDHEVSEVDTELVSDIDSLLSQKQDELYKTVKFKNGDYSIDIIYPALGYPGNSSLIMTPDRVRFLLSFYPYKNDFLKVEKILLRPRYIETGNIELAALFIKKVRTLVLYLTHSDMQSDSLKDNDRFISIELEHIMDTKVIESSIDKSKQGGARVPLLWNILAVINPDGDERLDKFFIRRDKIDNKEYLSLNDISYYYYRHGY
jgi:hypothetical protein